MMAMTIKPLLFGGSVDLPLQRLDSFNQVLLSEFSNRVAEVLLVPAVPEQFRLRIGDALFWYELLCSFLGDNVQVRKSADRISLIFKNARLRSDIDFIENRTARFLEAFASGPGQVAIFTAFCHGNCSSQEERDAFLAQFAVKESVVGPGLTGRVKVSNWPQLIKINAEASFIVPGGLFVGWETSYTNPKEKDASQDQQRKLSELIGPSFESAAEAFGLKIELPVD
jgi:hypothetical protein